VISLSFFTLGCKLNQFESESLAGAFVREGFPLIPWGEPADILVVNTCTVTSKAEQKARRIIRKALREHPRSCVIVTGCYAQLEGPALAALEAEDPAYGDRLLVVSGDLKSGLLALPRFLTGSAGGLPENSPPVCREPPAGGELAALIKTWIRRENRAAPGNPFRFNTADFSFHSRAFLKIQDGCDRRCSYCRVSLARGPSVSRGAEQVLERLRVLEEGGYGEAVLTGVNINQYRDGSRDLTRLLECLIGGTRRIALRLSSLEPEGITGDLAGVLAHPRVRPHFHLSVQSGSSRVLKRMGRPYTPEDVERGAALLRARREDPFLAGDIITGFPGETGEDFEETRDLCRRIGFAWIHAFPYSPRPGTAARDFPHPVSEREAVRRVEALLTLARGGRRDYIRRWMGKTVEAVIQANHKKKPGYFIAVSDNYMRLMIPAGGGSFCSGETLRCRISALLYGKGDAPDSGSFDALAEPV
jgi:threonylcarbamoyladenosine tRNA methylthiotransferase MtaB